MQKADLILRSNAIFTGRDDFYFPGSIAIASNKIIAVQKDSTLQELADEETKVYELGDRLIMPGFIDAHFHFFEGAVASSRYMCSEIEHSVSEEDCIRIMKKFSEQNPEFTRLLGTGWLQVNWGGAPLPTCESLDAAFPEKPVYLLSGDGHTFWLNTAALKECGITEENSVSFGEIGKTEEGTLNGILLEMEACALAWNKIYEPDQRIMEETQISLSEKAVSCGITSLCNMTSKPYYEGEEILYETAFRLSQENKLKCRLHLYPSLGVNSEFEQQKKLAERYNTGKFRVCGLKQFADGVTTTYTGYLLEPYEDNPSACGTMNYKREIYENVILAANREGFSVRLHTIADGSVRAALDIFEKSKQENPEGSIRNCLEHCEDIYPEDIKRFSELGVVASIQPIHLILDANEKVERLGKKRAEMEWPCKSLLEAGAVMALGTDYPVAYFNPFPNIQAAVTRCGEDGRPVGVNPWERIHMAEALKAYTYGGAYSFGREDELGTLEAGKLADIAVINQNLFKVKPFEIKDCSVYMTIVDGMIVYKEGGKQ